MSIELKNITRFYGAQKAVDNISFRIEKGEVAGFIGPNGAGKSTTMKIITGYLPPTGGEAFVAGLDTTSESLEIRKILGYLPENNPLYPEMYVREYL
ncbi:MAG: ATP-binding cassette domain-containing protein, partial [Bacteroidales bacterium]|nr:ATP-binding cassette domain-containing protein [Bacteroidales bacterium]